MSLEIICPYGNAYGQNHIAEKGGSVTYCGRDRYGWSYVREAELPADLESAYTCKRCAKKVGA